MPNIYPPLSLFQGKVEEALRAFETLVQQYPQSPRARYGKAQVLHSMTVQNCSTVQWYCVQMCWWYVDLQAEDDLAEKLRSNDMLQRAINSYREAADLPDVTSDLVKTALKRRAERQQFLGNANTDCSAARTTTRYIPACPSYLMK